MSAIVSKLDLLTSAKGGNFLSINYSNISSYAIIIQHLAHESKSHLSYCLKMPLYFQNWQFGSVTFSQTIMPSEYIKVIFLHIKRD